ncbi:KLTH0A01078p-like protein, partial [Metarhizium majus ARSEF 297]
MKPVVSAMHAWSCTVISVFAILILSVLAGLYRSGHEEFVGGDGDPRPGEEGKAVAGTIFTAVIVYAAFLVFCGFQGLLHVRENRRGAIAL